jgi:hypothetical protein
VRSLPFILCLLLPIGIARAGSGPTVVELFTSQGCNSCPPADALLGELARRTDVLALALHVTYWDDLGWRDRYALPAFDARQRDYVERLRLRTAYTPQLVVNGQLDAVGSQRNAVEAALAQSAHPEGIGLAAAGTDLQIGLPALASPCNCLITLFGFRAEADTRVGAGENNGRTLREFQVVRVMRTLGRWKGDAQVLHASLGGMPGDVDGYAVVAQQGTGGRIIAAGHSARPSAVRAP